VNQNEAASLMANRILCNRVIVACIFAVWLLIANPLCKAQLATTGTINGAVVDQAGAVVPGAKVTVTNEGTKAITHAVSNSSGSYSVVGLPSGKYDVTVNSPGFGSFNEVAIYLEPAGVFTVNVALKAGTVSTAITVSANAVAVQTATNEISNTVSGEEAQDLPLNGRNYEGLAQLMPGVINTAPDTAMGIGGFATSNYINVNGGGSSGTLYTLDGIWNENTGNMTQTTITPNPDEIEEIKVLQNNYESKYSLMGASVVLVQTKSGTSAFHGGAWEFLRNTFLDTRNFFVPAATGISPEEWNIYGWNIGGPIYIPHHYNASKEKTFFYFNQQWVRQKQGGVVSGATPTAAMRSGTFPVAGSASPYLTTANGGWLRDPSQPASKPCNATVQTGCFPNNQLPVSMINQADLALLNALAVLPNNQSTAFNNYINTVPTITRQHDEEAKVDHYITSKLHLTGEYFYEGQNAHNPNASRMGSPFSTNYDIFLSNNQLAQIQLTQIISPCMTNQTSIAMNNYKITHDFDGIVNVSQIQGYSQSFPYAGGYLEDRLPHVTFSGGWSQFGTSANNTIPNATDLEDTITDDWSWLRGKHFLQAGGTMLFGTKRQWETVSNTTGDINFNGSFTGNSIADYLLGDAATFAQGSDGFRKYIHYTIFSPYLEDRWSATRRLTITAGVRFFRMPFPNAQQGTTANFNPTLFSLANAPTVAHNGVLSGPNSIGYVNGIELNGKNGVPLNITNEHNFYVSPVIGFALDIFGNGRTSLRGGFGVTYNRNGGMGEACSQGCVSYPILSQTNLINTSFPNVTGGTAPAPTAGGVSGMPRDYQIAKIETWSLSWQQQLGTNWLLSIAGAGNKVNHLNTSYNINQPPPVSGYDFNPNLNLTTYTSAYYAPYQGYGSITWYNPIGVDNWNALEVGLRHPAGHHIYLTMAYTWSHNLDNNGGFQNIYNLKSAYGNSTLNTPNVFNASIIYSLPMFNSGWKQAVFGGWKYSDMTTIQSGSFQTMGLSGSGLGLASRPNQVGRLTYPKTWKPYQYSTAQQQWFSTGTTTNPIWAKPAAGFFGNVGNGTIEGPGVTVSNMALYKSFPIRESAKLEFRTEYFNIFNHTNPNGPNTTFGAGAFGTITSAKDPRIGELSLKLNF